MAFDLYLVRHGDTEWSRTGQHTGITDLPLLPEGETQVAQLCQPLSAIQFAAAYTSDRRRAFRTAELAGHPEAVPTPLLREVDYGEYEGVTTAEIWAQRPGWRLFVDGCPGGETPNQVLERAQAFIDQVSRGPGPVLAFSHGHFVRALGVTWVEWNIAAAEAILLDTAAVCVLRESDRGRVIERWNWSPDL